MRLRLASAVLFLVTLRSVIPAIAAQPSPEALLVIIGDSHSAYDKFAPLVAHVDRLKAGHPGVPLAVLINGDAFEYGNIVARRGHGEVDLAFFAALAKRAPTILNLGNHEMDFFGPAEVVPKIAATGVVVISANARDRASGRTLAPAATKLPLGRHDAVVVGLMTDRLDTFRKAIQPELDLGNPVTWAKQHLPALTAEAALPIVLSHSGLRADREILGAFPGAWRAGGLYAGAHDHQRFVERDYYFHSGSWLEFFTLAQLERDPATARVAWRLQQIPIEAAAPGDPALAALVQRARATHLTPADNAPVARLPRAWPVAQAAAFAAAAIARATQSEVGFIGNTTFGAGLPAGEVTQADYDACVRFDGPVFTATVDGARLRQLLAASGQGPDTPFEQRGGEFNFSGRSSGTPIDPAKTYAIATSDWGAKNTDRYFGEPAIAWTQHPTARVKPAVREALEKVR